MTSFNFLFFIPIFSYPLFLVASHAEHTHTKKKRIASPPSRLLFASSTYINHLFPLSSHHIPAFFITTVYYTTKSSRDSRQAATTTLSPSSSITPVRDYYNHAKMPIYNVRARNDPYYTLILLYAAVNQASLPYIYRSR